MTLSSAHQSYLTHNYELFQGENHPEADTTRAWIDMATALPGGMANRVKRYVDALDLNARPGLYPLTRAVPGGEWCNSDPLIMAVGRALEPEVSRLIGRRAWMSFGGINIHYRGVPTVRHRDMGFYRYLVSWPVICDTTDPWAIHIERPSPTGDAADDVFHNTSPARALLFAGHDVQHWRDPYPGGRAVSFFMRYTAYEPVRCHTQREVDTIADAGLREMSGIPLDGETLALITAECTSQRLAYPTAPYAILRGAVPDVERGNLARNVRRIVADTGPAIFRDCALAGHEHLLASGFCRSISDSDWVVDAASNPYARVRVIVGVRSELTVRVIAPDKAQQEIVLGRSDAAVIRADIPFFVTAGECLTALYGLPPHLRGETHAALG